MLITLFIRRYRYSHDFLPVLYMAEQCLLWKMCIRDSASTYYFTSYTQPEWWWGYPGYWGPGYWGGNWGGGWYYPYAVTYSYSTNSFLTEMVNLKAEQGDNKKLPVVWTSYLTGFETGSKAVNRTLAVEAVNQSFTQSPYLTNK